MKDEKIEEAGGELTTIPNKKYQAFFDKFAEIDTLEISNWGKAHLMGYFCRKYKETYNVDYQWKFNHQLPSKCFEVWQFNTLCAKLSTNPKILKDYIDWVFQNVVPKAKRRLTSISFMTKDAVVIPYKMNVLLAEQTKPQIDRSTPLPIEYIQVLEKHSYHASCYGDLAFLSQMDPMPSEMGLAIQELQGVGFDPAILGRII